MVMQKDEEIHKPKTKVRMIVPMVQNVADLVQQLKPNN